MSYKWIRANEIAEFVYCRRAWWLKHTYGWQSANMNLLNRGSRYHDKHGNQLRQASLIRGLAYVLLFSIVAYVVFQIITGW